jgi:hypothetical protein
MQSFDCKYMRNYLVAQIYFLRDEIIANVPAQPLQRVHSAAHDSFDDEGEIKKG